MSVQLSNYLTLVTIAYRKRRHNHRLVFGTPVLDIRRNWCRRFAAFEPEQMFGYERWQANQYGTQDWRIFVCRARYQGAITRVPGVMPGAEILLSAIGKTQVKRVLRAIDHFRNDGVALVSVPPHQWRTIHNSIQTKIGMIWLCEGER
ncbi:MAG: DUF2840 domain-containing protein [Pseudomonadota bacterium]